MLRINRALNGTLALLSKISIPISLSSRSAGHGVATFTVTLHDGNGKQLDSQTKSVDVRGSSQSQSFDVVFTSLDYQVTNGFIVKIQTSTSDRNASTATPGISTSSVTVGNIQLSYVQLSI